MEAFEFLSGWSIEFLSSVAWMSVGMVQVLLSKDSAGLLHVQRDPSNEPVLVGSQWSSAQSQDWDRGPVWQGGVQIPLRPRGDMSTTRCSGTGLPDLLGARVSIRKQLEAQREGLQTQPGLGFFLGHVYQNPWMWAAGWRAVWRPHQVVKMGLLLDQ